MDSDSESDCSSTLSADDFSTCDLCYAITDWARLNTVSYDAYRSLDVCSACTAKWPHIFAATRITNLSAARELMTIYSKACTDRIKLHSDNRDWANQWLRNNEEAAPTPTADEKKSGEQLRQWLEGQKKKQ